MKAYISGPMTGLAGFGFNVFDEVSAAWRAQGNEAISPAEHDRDVLGGREAVESAPGYADGDVAAFAAATGFDYATAMTWDMTQCIEADAIVMLPGWERSTGARAERFVSEMTGKVVFLAWKYGDEWVIMPDIAQKRVSTTADLSYTVAAS